jgi:cystathionine beta-synthase
VALELDDPEALVVVILPDGGRSYLSKIFNDAWMTQHGFLPRQGELTVGEVMEPGIVTVGTAENARQAVALMHEHRVSQLAVLGSEGAIVGSVGERGLLRRVMGDAAVLDARVTEVMEPPFPVVAAADSVRGAIEQLAGPRSALTVIDDGRPVGIVTRSDLLEALAR